MTRKKVEAKCEYCGGVFAASGMTAHVRHKHPDKYTAFKENRAAIIEKNKIVERQPAPEVAESAPTETMEEVETVTTPEPEPTRVDKPDAPALEQKSGSFLASVAKSLRDW